ncbi:type II toxin-antitoxin system RelE/ParE family toxin [Methylocystis bryophila]|uniref:Plasmid stabilization protein n=1 Tax=Methylocystis bryophila TaxID=655015 RepID=A0A1W6MT16_9HYPH|nr:type II toxin-antitoxin system RelE/ParE family toxin [Methylocystis bryophila]ARN80734.1 hypothetical protein B1812_06225 [Methylocystis bryophila]BDV40810.1 plasmid stabilization protein [Methylocystis bryophila]
MSRLLLTEKAVGDLEKFGDDIALYSPTGAERIIARIEEIVSLLRDFPRIGTPRDDIERGMRIFPVGNYLILFGALDDGVEIVRVVDGRSHPRRWL